MHEVPSPLEALTQTHWGDLLAADIVNAVALSQTGQRRLIEVLEVLGMLRMDAWTARCAVYSALRVEHSSAAIADARLATMLAGHLEATQFADAEDSAEHKQGAEGRRRLFLVLSRDLRVLFVLLAEQLVRMRHANLMTPAERTRLARQTESIHAPMANRLGIWQVKWELEDLAFRYLQPDAYRRVAALLDERRTDRERFIEHFLQALRGVLQDAHIDADVQGRPKHIYSIWKKMQRKHLEFSDLYDVRAVRVLVADVPNCYAALAAVHERWPYIPAEFDDYIAHPKGNQYRSLHTAVTAEDGRPVEIQIRTGEMHAHAELGVAAHWRYKEGGSSDADFERRINQLRDVLTQRGDELEDPAMLEWSTAVLADRIYVLTPKGQVIGLSRGSTVLDFAYHIHTEVGHRCRGAKVNGRIVPLSHTPVSGDRIEILTARESQPRRDWLNPSLGYLTSSRARHKIKAWFNLYDQEQNARDGREILEREIRRTVLVESDLLQILPKLQLRKLEELYVEVALGDVTPGQVMRMLGELHAVQAPAPVPQPSRPARKSSTRQDTIVIDGIGGLLWRMAQCCKPLPGDEIMGYVTRGAGVAVHRADCRSLKTLIGREPERLIDVQWGQRRGQRFPVQLRIEAFDRNGLLRDITAIFAAENLGVLSVQTRSADGEACMDFTIEVEDFGQLTVLMGKLRGVPNVIEAKRLQ